MNLPYSLNVSTTIGLLLLSAAAFCHAQAARSDGVGEVSNGASRLLEVVPMVGPPLTFKSGQLVVQPNNSLAASGWTYAEQDRLCERIESGDPSALATLQAEVDQQHAWAQRVMAMYYLDPRSALVPRDRSHALQLYRDAAKQGDLSSQYMLGWMLRAGAAFGPDFVEARYWLEKAAAQGSSDAMALLGGMLRDGMGGDTDLAGAIVEFRKAADDNNGHALLDLAAAYANGEGVDADLVQAYKWSLAASRNAGKGNFGAAVKSYLETVASKLQPQQIDEATMQAKEWLSLHPVRAYAMPPKRFDPDFDPKQPCTRPGYPKESLTRGEQGIVKIKLRIDAKGRVTGTDLVKSSGVALLDQATITAFAQCRFTPALRFGVAVEGTKEISVPWTGY